jgi:hypothetical protein
LADALPDPAGAPPCRNAHRTWFRAGEIFAREQAFSWRDCLQALVSGDYLSPAFIGLGFRDNLAPARYIVGGPSLIADRAALLEEAFERHYDYVVGDHQRAGEKQQSIRGIDGATGLRRRFGYLPLAYAEAGEDKSWLPLLLLNSTSVQTGCRIIASDLSSTFKGQNGPVGLYSQAYDLFEVMSSHCNAPDFDGQNCPAADQSKASSTVQLDAPDVLLSTAALTSARFPILSPAGAFVIKDQPKYGDRLVDGGYFENSGDSTALDIAEALIAHSIQPIILSISNDPEEPIANIAVPRRPTVTPFVGASSNGLLARVLGILSVPFETLVSTRDGHAAEAKDLADKTLANCGPTKCAAPGFFKLGVVAQPNLSVDTAADPWDHERCKDFWTNAKVHVTALSMSWWLSASVQAEIDAQRCDKENRSILANLMLRLSPQENAAR